MAMTIRLGSLALIFFIVAITIATALADEADDAKAVRQMRLDHLKACAAECELFQSDDRTKPLTLTAAPLLRFTNPVSTVTADGTTFLWLAGERPVAVATWSIR